MAKTHRTRMCQENFMATEDVFCCQPYRIFCKSANRLFAVYWGTTHTCTLAYANMQGCAPIVAECQTKPYTEHEAAFLEFLPNWSARQRLDQTRWVCVHFLWSLSGHSLVPIAYLCVCANGTRTHANNLDKTIVQNSHSNIASKVYGRIILLT